MITPLNVRLMRDFVAFDFTLTVRLNSPARPLGWKVIFISPFFPGAIGLLGKEGLVQPQPPLLTLMMVSGADPVLVNS